MENFNGMRHDCERKKGEKTHGWEVAQGKGKGGTIVFQRAKTQGGERDLCSGKEDSSEIGGED